jgi:hypothetical protein
VLGEEHPIELSPFYLESRHVCWGRVRKISPDGMITTVAENGQ